ncbi:hypothetical protein WJX81_002909 [Elliptochloris bilobata]|uniref:RING-type domain-containing protein n=1 Tax=Elliptochloris bilobata TaxID=381761 RepID=A0AAW1SDS1_9CHLO
MGFSSWAKDTLSALHCARCRGLYYDAVRTSCGHYFCRACIQPFSDCLLCGADIASLEAEPRLQGLVDACIAAGQGSASGDAVGMGRVGPWVGGGGDALACQLGAVCGSQGDCCRELGDTDAAAEAYRESVAHLRRRAVQTPEVLRALALSTSKLGDMAYRQGDLSAARALYHHALAARRAALANVLATPGAENPAFEAGRMLQGEGAPQPAGAAAVPQSAGAAARAGGYGTAGPPVAAVPLALDLATSVCKVADLERALGNKDAATAALREATSLLATYGLRAQAMGGALAAKAQALQGFLAGPIA